MKTIQGTIIERKIIQVCTKDNKNIVALCDDGTIWEKSDGWFQIDTYEIDVSSDNRHEKKLYDAKGK